MNSLPKQVKLASTKPTILLVDSQLENLEQLEATLNNDHIDILKAQSSTEAFAYLFKHDLSLVLIDAQMPDMSAYEIAQHIRSNRKTRSVPIIFIADQECGEVATVRGYRAGAIDFIQRPVSPLILQSKVAVFLELDQNKRQLHRAYAQLDGVKAYYESILNAAGEGMLGLDYAGNIEFVNPAACELFGCNGHDELIGQSFHAFYPVQGGMPVSWEETPFFNSAHSGTELRIAETEFSRMDGSRFPVSLCCSALPGKARGAVVVFQNISTQKALEEQLRRQALTDHLTELSNRNGFKSSLQTSLERSKRSHKGLAVMFIDLDHFKRINDTFGHDVGDSMLQAAALRLKECVRSYDLVSRIGGDEFTIVLEELNDNSDAALIARKILAALRKPFMLQDGIEITVGASIGISTYPECGSDVDVLMQAADVAMYQSKNDGRNLYQFYLPEMNAKAKHRLMLEQALRIAVEDDKFMLHYQPQVDLTTGKVVGFEALLRWHHDEIGTISPGTFVPVLEETGLIVPIGQWVFSTSCRQRQQWKETLPEECSLSINLSPRQFTDKNLVNEIQRVLDVTELPPHQLEIELTEGMLMQDTEYTQNILRSLKNMGLKLSIDDFGTGYSSLAYLKQFSLDSLKIDKQFIDNLTTSEKDAAIATSIIQLAHNLGLQVIAEGVETEEQVLALQELGCDVVQGYYFGRPISAQEVARFPHSVSVH